MALGRVSGVRRRTAAVAFSGLAGAAVSRLTVSKATAALGLALLAGACSVESGSSEPVLVASRADNFRLVDHNGFAQELYRLKDADAVVLVTQVNGDETSRAAAKTLEALKAANPRVEVFMLNSSPEDGRAEIVAEATAQGFKVPVLDDAVQLVGEQLGVSRAGEAFVLDPKTWKVVYHGGVDGSGAALAAMASGGAMPASSGAGKGVAIAFPARAQAGAVSQISYSATIAPILEAKCVVCHQVGGIGPFAMTNYEVVKGFAPMIREAIRTSTMPPWHPDPTIGRFKNDKGLSPDEIRSIVHWIEAGAPRGEGEDPLTLVEHVAPEWPLGPPDLVIEAPAYTIPASGVVEYQYPHAPNPLTEGRWVKAATLLPGDRQGVHHILAGYMSKQPVTGRGSSMSWEGSYGEYAVGGESWMTPDNVGVYLPAGGSMGFQFHYTPFGKEVVDRSKMGFYFYPKGEEPELMMHHFVIGDTFIELPPNTDWHKEVAYTKFPKEAVLHSVFLHTHYRGQAARFDLVRPDGSTETLVNVPRYDFNWQRTYDLEEPVTIPAGSKLVATYWYDNTARNPGNPDPTQTVTWGDQSWEEMHYTSIYFRWADETVAKPADATPQMNALRMMGILDDNLDDKIQESELRGRIAAMIKPRFAALDVNADGGIDEAELSVVSAMLPRFGRGSEGGSSGASGGAQ
ncbi:hypothetical protein GC169_03685 [bacterium]|nr:hypothetical protein [bacterium]